MIYIYINTYLIAVHPVFPSFQPSFHHCPQDSCTSHRNAGNGFSVGTASGPKEIWASFCAHDGIFRSPYGKVGVDVMRLLGT